jgi:hypothetical protein
MADEVHAGSFSEISRGKRRVGLFASGLEAKRTEFELGPAKKLAPMGEAHELILVLNVQDSR